MLWNILGLSTSLATGSSIIVPHCTVRVGLLNLKPCCYSATFIAALELTLFVPRCCIRIPYDPEDQVWWFLCSHIAPGFALQDPQIISAQYEFTLKAYPKNRID